MGTTKVLLIESARNNGRTFSSSLQRKYEVAIAHSGKQALAIARDMSPQIIILDADSLRTPGDRISIRLRDQLGELPIIHIKSEGAERGQSVADVMLYLPFTIRKLSNRIEQYAVKPAEEAAPRETGPFNLNLETQTLTTPWNEKKLTPKLIALMQLFLQHPDQTLERKQIMQQVWDTDYVEDTRTLDVHIRWLRQAVEPKPRKPQYLVTVRGVGYRFGIPDVVEVAEVADKSKSTEASPPTDSQVKQKKLAQKADQTKLTKQKSADQVDQADRVESLKRVSKRATDPPPTSLAESN
ncbi:MAG: response regulator transcription factor [Anaerolineae bacterium]|nr:response regulator transcription factor [Anaerolineae bacterium]